MANSSKPSLSEVKDLLDLKLEQFAGPEFFIPTDPIQIPHSFSDPADIEIAAMLSAIIAWGQRKSIITNAKKWMAYMDNAPFQFLSQAQEKDFKPMEGFVHRTLNGFDCKFISIRLSELLKEHGSIDKFLMTSGPTLKDKIIAIHQYFNNDDCLARTAKHFANPAKGSAAKRWVMLFRWMVRPASAPGADFGIWNCLKPADLMLPLDVHTKNVSHKLGILTRKQQDWKAVEEVSSVLRSFDPTDPAKYDYALFGLGAFEQF